MNREEMLGRLGAPAFAWDLIVVGGGATGLGVAVDAASRGYGVLLLERGDFSSGTSSRSTKLIHGGVRYLQQGNLSLVLEALRERGLLQRNAPHLVSNLRFVVPNYEWWEAPFYGVGLKLYDLMAGKHGFGASRYLSREETIERLPTIETEGLRGGIIYHDGQFDDARLAINLAQTAAENGATVLNYAKVTALLKSEDLVAGVEWHDVETGEVYEARARAVVNATGAFSDELRLLDDTRAQPIISPSQGVHIVLDRAFLPGNDAIMVPHTDDGRIIFMIPWNGRIVVGTTDTPIAEATPEPEAEEGEVEFLLETSARYLIRNPTRADVLSVFVGIRPLVKGGAGEAGAALSREHTVSVSKSGLVTIAGGKWTTYRKMAQDTVDLAATVGGLPERPCRTEELRIHGCDEKAPEHGPLAVYGSDAPALRHLVAEDPRLAEPLHPSFSHCAGEVVWSVRHEMARSLTDVLARRTRVLLLDARAGIEIAPRVAELMARELGRDDAWILGQLREFRSLAERSLLA